MQIEISFDEADLVDFYERRGITVPEEIAAKDKAAWLQANVLEPYVDSCLLTAITSARENKAHEAAIAATKGDQEALDEKVRERQRQKTEKVSAVKAKANNAKSRA